MTDYKCLEVLTEKYKNYLDDESYVYKTCNNFNHALAVIVIMQKLEDTKTNEDRDDVIDKAHAKFRANKLKVIEIVNINNSNDTKNFVINEYDEILTKYEVGQIVFPDKYNEDIHNVCSGGIHYFKTLESAFFYRNVPNGYTGYWVDRHENGQKYREGKWLNNNRIGLWTKWYSNGQKKSEGTYVDDKRTGRWIEWDDNGGVIDDHDFGHNGTENMNKTYTYIKLLFAFGVAVLGTIVIGSKFIN